MATASRSIDEQTRRAWEQYAERLRDLEGSEYDAAENEAWEQLQATLRTLRRDEARLRRLSVG